MNKAERVKAYSKADQKNYILMGDVVEDTEMIQEVDYESALKIGFLNNTERDSHLIEAYESDCAFNDNRTAVFLRLRDHSILSSK